MPWAIVGPKVFLDDFGGTLSVSAFESKLFFNAMAPKQEAPDFFSRHEAIELITPSLFEDFRFSLHDLKKALRKINEGSEGRKSLPSDGGAMF